MATLDEGVLVVKAWVVVVDPFEADATAAGHSCYVSLGSGAGLLTNYDTNFNQPGGDPQIAGREAQSDTAITHFSQRVIAGGQPLGVEIYPGTGSFDAGALDVYALIAEPA